MRYKLLGNSFSAHRVGRALVSVSVAVVVPDLTLQTSISRESRRPVPQATGIERKFE
jgi:hypothetical protein